MSTRIARAGVSPATHAGPAPWTEVACAWEHWEGPMMHHLDGVNPVLARALELSAGRRVIDLGCGTGEPALEFARVVGPRGHVLGVDVSPGMIAAARRRARRLGLRNVRFLRADAARAPLPRVDAVTSRFGFMFVDPPVPTLERLRGLLPRGGRIAFAVWGPVARNAQMQITHAIGAALRGAPQPDPEGIPHPLRYGRRGRLEALLREAGFRDTATEGVMLENVHPDPDTFARCMVEISPSLAELLASVPARRRAWAMEQLRMGAARHVRDGAVRLQTFAWVVSGRR